MARAISESRMPRLALAVAAACLMRARVRMNRTGIRRWLIGKFSMARWVWAPYSASSGTSTVPMLSVSVFNSALPMQRYRRCSGLTFEKTTVLVTGGGRLLPSIRFGSSEWSI